MEATLTGYTDEHAAAGVSADLPEIDTWPNQYPGRGYTIEIDCPEFTSVCPKTGLPDFGKLVVVYEPADRCLELKSLKLHLLEYRNLPIFQENVVNKVLDAVVKASEPVWAKVEGQFEARGGISTTIAAEYRR